jgi:hypothetical protein
LGVIARQCTLALWPVKVKTDVSDSTSHTFTVSSQEAATGRGEERW